MKNDTDKLGLLLHDASRAVRKRFEALTSHQGLSSSQWRLLAHLLRGGRMTQTRLADLLEIEPISVSRLIDRMEQGGWVRREPDPKDRRVRLVVPTERALETQTEIRAIADDVYAEALRGLPAEARAELIGMLKTVISNLGSADADICDGHSPATHS